MMTFTKININLTLINDNTYARGLPRHKLAVKGYLLKHYLE